MRSLIGFRFAVLLAFLSVWGARQVDAATLVVDTTDDSFDIAFTTEPVAAGSCLLSNLTDLPGPDGVLSLREAIVVANGNAGPDSITFDPSLSGETITITFDFGGPPPGPDQLFSICDDGTSVDGDFDPSNPGPDITLDGSQTVYTAAERDSADGITTIASNTTINGLRVIDFADGGIGVLSIGGTTISGNRVTNNVVERGTGQIFLQAGIVYDTPEFTGGIADT